MSAAPVLVVGAGPVGLVLACDLAWRGVPVRIVDATSGPSTRSKAIGVFARTLELLENIGTAESIVRKAVGVESIDIHSGARRIASVDTTLIASRYNRVYMIEQSETERVLIERLETFGVQVEWSVRLESLRLASAHVEAVLRHADGRIEEAAVPWLVGCDGAHSTVRKTLEIPFEGERYPEAFDLADVRLEGAFQPVRSISLFLSRRGVVFLAPLPGESRFRVIVDEPAGSAEERLGDPELEDVRGWWDERVEYPEAREAVMAEAEWLSRFTIHRRMTPILRQGRVFLAGDAAHVHSPAGAQGMNGGIQDAINLSWKLSLVTQRVAHASLLDSYAEERLPVMRAVLRATHLLTKVATVDNALVQSVRAHVISAVLRRTSVQRRMVNLASGLYTDYRGSSIVGRKASRGITPGDRAPDGVADGAHRERLYDHFQHPGYTLLSFEGPRPDAASRERLDQTLWSGSGGENQVRRVTVTQGDAEISGAAHVVSDSDGSIHAAYGLPAGGLCLVRPDRYVGACTPGFHTGAMRLALGLALNGEAGGDGSAR